MTMPRLIPESSEVMEILKKTGAYREGHFVYPSGQHTPHYFQMPLAFRYYDTARVLAVALSRKLRLEKDISSALPKVSIISPSPGGIPVAFAVREALSADQIYWAELDKEGKRRFRQYVNKGEVYPAVIVDDISRTGGAIDETVGLLREMGTRIIGCGTIVRFKGAPDQLEATDGDDPVPILSLVEFDAKWYEDGQDCADCGKDAPVEHVRF
jgi:orotate phosphoribosyltransferase